MDDLERWVSPGRWLGRTVIVRAETRSTNDDARALAADGAASGTLVIAELQTAGRGRAGRTWLSPPGDNLAFSWVYRPALPLRSIAPLPLAVGLAVAEALDETDGVERATVKWPNDVRVGGLKVAGVLVEASLSGDGVAWAVVGVGINVGGERPPAGMEATATTLTAAAGRRVERASVLTAVVGRLEARLDRFGHQSFAHLRDALRARCDTLGRAVNVGGVSGVAEDIDPDGALVVRTPEGRVERVYSGDVAQ